MEIGRWCSELKAFPKCLKCVGHPSQYLKTKKSTNIFCNRRKLHRGIWVARWDKRWILQVQYILFAKFCVFETIKQIVYLSRLPCTQFLSASLQTSFANLMSRMWVIYSASVFNRFLSIFRMFWTFQSIRCFISAGSPLRCT